MLVEVGLIVLIKIVAFANFEDHVVFTALGKPKWNLLPGALRDITPLNLTWISINLAVWIIVSDHLRRSTDLLAELRHNIVSSLHCTVFGHTVIVEAGVLL